MKKDKQKWISDKIKKLKSEGKSQEQAVAISLNMYNSMLKGGMYEENKYQGESYINNPYFPPAVDNSLQGFIPQYQQPYYLNNNINQQQEMQNVANSQIDPSLQNITPNQINPSRGGVQSVMAPNFMEQREGVKEIRQNGLEQWTNEGINKIENSYYSEEDYLKRNPQKQPQQGMMFNPFGGIGLEQSLAYAGQGFGAGNTSQGLVGSTLAGLKGARTFLSGFSVGKEEKRLDKEYKRKMEQDPRYIMDYQEGGTLTLKDIAELKQATGVEFTEEGANSLFMQPQKVTPQEQSQFNLGKFKGVPNYYNVRQSENGVIITAGNRNLKNANQYKEDLIYLQQLNPNLTIEGIQNTQHYVPLSDRMQEGGKTNGDLLTGEYLIENPNEMGNVEVEGGEYTENSETGQIQEVVGEKHSNGGVETNLPNQSKVISDYTKIGSENAKKFKEQFDVKVRATDTFATVLDKVNKSIGLDKLIEEEKEIYEKIEKQDSDKTIKDNVKSLNLTALQKKLQDITKEKETLKSQQKGAFDKIFEEQEKIPKKGDEKVMKEGGILSEDLEFLSKKYKLDKNKIMDLMQEGGTYTNRQRLKDWLAEAKGLGYEGDFNIDSDNLGEEAGKLQKFFAEKFPEQVINYFQKQPINAKGIEIIKKNNPDLFKKAEISKNKKPADYTKEERLKLQNLYRETNPEDKSFWLDQFQDNTWNTDNVDTWRTISVPQKLEQSSIDTVINFTKPNINTPDLATPPIQIDSNQEAVEQNKTDKNKINGNFNMPFIPQDFILPPSARQPVYKQSVELGRIDPVKVSAEPNMVEIERQRQAIDEATRFLPPAQRASVLANALGQTQSASNQAISQVEATNAQSQYNADIFNLQARTKEDLLNSRFEQDYEAKTMAAIGNQEMDIRNYFNDLNNQQRYNFDYIDRRNLLNQAYPQFNVQGSSNINFAGGTPFQDISKFLNPQTVNGKPFSELTDAERDAWRLEQMKNMGVIK